MRSPSMAASRCSLVLRRHGRAIGRRFELSGAAVVTWGAADERVDVSHVPALRTGSHGRLDIFGELRRDHCADYADRAMLTHQVAADTRDLDHPAGPRRSRPSSPGQPERGAFSTAGLATVSRRRHLPPEVPSVSVERTRENLSLMRIRRSKDVISATGVRHSSEQKTVDTNQPVSQFSLEAEKVAGGLFSVEAASNPHSRT